MSIGENIKRIREANGLKQVDLAERANISQSMLCQLERGTKTLSAPLQKVFADILGCDVNDFYA